ncbi:MAG: hypothetical protein ACOX0F_09755 [Syntrophomonadaceae bacterium]
MRAGVWYHPDFAEKGHPILRHRVKPGFEALQDLIATNRITHFTPRLSDDIEKLLALCHEPGHIQRVRYEGYHQVALLSAAGVVQAAEMLSRGELDFAFCFVGTAGHHASRREFWGFCYYNDAAMAVMKLRQLGAGNIMIIDVDPHFGDGTRNLLGKDPGVIHINFHSQYKLGQQDDKLNNYDIGLPLSATDNDFLQAIDRVLERSWDYELLMVIFGHDSHHNDYGAFALTETAFEHFARKIHDFSRGKPVLFILSGGSNAAVAKAVIPMIIKAFV